MATKTEVSATFVLDDKSKAAMDKIKGGFGEISGAADQAQSRVVGFFKEAAATALGFQLAATSTKLLELGKEGFQKALDLQETQKQLTGLMTLTNKAGTDWGVLTQKAQSFNRELDNFSTKNGIAKNTAQQLYTTLAETFNTSRSFITASGKSITLPLNQWEKAFQRTEDDMKKFMQNIATAGKGVAGGPEALAQAFNNFSAQGAKATDPIVQMIAATGTLKGNAKQVAQQLNMLTDASAMSFAQKAIGTFAKQMVGAPATMATVMQQLSSMKDQFLAGFGAPIVKAVVPAVESFKNKIEQNRATIDSMVKFISEKLSGIMTSALKALEKGLDYAVNHAQDFKNAIESGFKTAEKIMNFILAHKEEIAFALGARAISGAASAAAPLANGAMSAGSSIVSGLGGAGAAHIAAKTAALGPGAQLTGVNAAAAAAGGTATGLAAFSAAIVGVGAAVYMATDYIKEFGAVLPWHVQANDNLKATIEAAKGWADGTRKATVKDYEQMRKQVFEFGEAAGYTSKELKNMAQEIDHLYDVAKKNQKAIDKAQDAADAMRETMNSRWDMEQQGIKQNPNDAKAEDAEQLKTFVDAYNDAVNHSNKVQMQAIAKMFESNAALQQVFLKSGVEVAGGFELLASMIDESSGDFKKKLMGIANAPNMGQNPKVEFNNNTFQIKQDFRDQDPDRVAMIFKRDIVNAAENRRNAKVGGVFGS